MEAYVKKKNEMTARMGRKRRVSQVVEETEKERRDEETHAGG